MDARKQFTPEFKREAMQLLESGSRPASELACEVRIWRNQLYKWQREFQARGAGGVPRFRGPQGVHHRTGSAEA